MAQHHVLTGTEVEVMCTGAARALAGPRGSTGGGAQHEELSVLVGVAGVGGAHPGSHTARRPHRPPGTTHLHSLHRQVGMDLIIIVDVWKIKKCGFVCFFHLHFFGMEYSFIMSLVFFIIKVFFIIILKFVIHWWI